MIRAALNATVAYFARLVRPWLVATETGSIVIPVVEIREADPRIGVQLVAVAPPRLPGLGRN